MSAPARSAWQLDVLLEGSLVRLVEAKLLMLGHAFDALGCQRVEFETDAENERSRRALAALPAQFEGIRRDDKLVRGDTRRSSAYYSVLDREWPAVRENLERRLARHA